MKVANHIGLIVLLLLICGSAQAEPQHALLQSKHAFTLGGYSQEADSEFYASVDELPTAKLNLGDLGVDDKDQGETGFEVQFTGPAAYLAYSF